MYIGGRRMSGPWIVRLLESEARNDGRDEISVMASLGDLGSHVGAELSGERRLYL